jgi:sulfatase modifying factor 1
MSNAKAPILIGGLAALMLMAAQIGGGGAARAADAPKPGAVFRDCPDCAEMVVIPAGAYVMGSTPEERKIEGVPTLFGDRESPQVKVTIPKPFALSKTEVTRAQFQRFLDETKPPPQPDCGISNMTKDGSKHKDNPGFSFSHPPFPQTDADPAICISWDEAHAFAVWMAKKTGKPYRLPSEEEWEYGARANTTTARYWGANDVDACDKASMMTTATFEAMGHSEDFMDKLMCGSDKAFTLPVASFDPNPFGLYDMLGSVWEWTEDCATPTHAGAPADGSAVEIKGCDKRIVKGGAFHSVPWLLRAATRGGGLPASFHAVAAGIRLARDLN